MTRDEVLHELENLGTAQNRKVYARHGITNSFGVSFANLYKLQKQIKVNHPLAEELWESGNHDARQLACLIGDPAQMKFAVLDRWVKEAGDDSQCGGLAGLAAKSAHAWKCVEKWTAQPKKERVAAAGWSVLAALAVNDMTAGDDKFEPYLPRIQADIHSSPNRVRYAMNGALIAIGGRSDMLEPKALAVAKAIGKVEVDHGETCCKTPDATSYIHKMSERRKSKAKKPTARKKVKA
jgi:3-methyladenine DNA glycosylase AlkD